MRDTVQTFIASAQSGRLAHAYAVIGAPAGQGKEFAHQALQYLLCTEEAKPCGLCPACRQVINHGHADVLWVEPESKSRVIKIEQIRNLNKRIAQTSFAGGWKAGVIMHADRLNDAAANAFLKTLEEPPGQSILLLLTDAPQALLPTILSRCQRITLTGGARADNQPWRAPLLELLRQIPAEDPLQCAQLASELNSILDDEKARISEEAEAEHSEEDDKILDARISARLRETRAEIMLDVLEWQRDVLLSVVGADDKLYRHTKQIPEIRKQAEGVSCADALSRVQSIDAMVRQLERNMPPIAVFEAGLGMGH